MSFRPADEEARERTRRDHATTLVLEAGAGTGKTTLIVDRLESLVRSGTTRLDEVAAVTFTENAAATLKLRLRERLETVRADAEVPAVERRRAAAALDVLERAQVSTIHAFCAALLQERPLECGVVPGFRVCDETESDALFAEAWDEWLTAALDEETTVLAAAVRADIPLESFGDYGEGASLRGFARTLLWQRDLEPLVAEEKPDPVAWRKELQSVTAQVGRLLEQAPADDMLTGPLRKLVEFAEAARFLEGDALLAHLLNLAAIRGGLGRKDAWPEGTLEPARGHAAWAGETKVRWAKACGSSLHADLVRALLGVVRRYDAKKAARGALDYVDLLVKARDALRSREEVRRYFRGRYRHLLIDEFQDTDPLQVQIAQLLTDDQPGRLVVVGDAKQSIYRFRRAEVSLFRRVSALAAGRPGNAVLRLSQNFRSRPGIIRFVNQAFSALIQQSDVAAQPAYEPLDARPDLPEGAAVVGLDFEADPTSKEALIRSEAWTVAAFVATVAQGGEEVRDPETGQSRRSRAGDVMILAPRLTQTRELEEQLLQAGLRFTVEGGRSFFNRAEVHEVLAVLRALDDATDKVALVAALRSAFFGVSDADLVAHALAGAPLALFPATEVGSESVVRALTLLRELHESRTRASIPALLETLFARTRILAALSGTRRGQGQVANLEKVLALARQAVSLDVLTVRGFVRLLQERVVEGSDEPDLPSTRPGDPDTVRILSIHKAKGLEAPVVVLYDQAASLQVRPDVIALWDESKVAIGFREGCRPPGWKELQDTERARAWAEGRRLLYVACTRARDLLVVPCPESGMVGDFWKDLVGHVRSADASLVRRLPATELAFPPREAEPEPSGPAEEQDASGARWDATRAALLAAARDRVLEPVSVTAAVADAPAPVVSDIVGGSRAFGGLVHQMLEWIAFDAGGTAPAMAEALAPGFGLDPDAAVRAGDAVQRALALPIMERARASPRVFRELPLWFADGERLVEGIIDLAFEEDGALVVVDYKTDHIAPEQALEQAAHHAPQLQLYGRGLAQAMSMPVRERLVLFTHLGRTVAV